MSPDLVQHNPHGVQPCGAVISVLDFLFLTMFTGLLSYPIYTSSPSLVTEMSAGQCERPVMVTVFFTAPCMSIREMVLSDPKTQASASPDNADNTI